MIYDAIVLGTGGVGSAALYHLARRGVRALGLDRFPAAHDRGSSHGQTRIIRQAYFEHPDYVPLVLRAYDLWRDLEAQTGQRLFHQTGLLQVGPPEGEVLQGVLTSAARHNLAVEELTADEIEARWPAFRVEPGMRGAFEAQAGYLEVENCVRAHLDQATRLGAEFRPGESVRRWTSEAGEVVVETDSQTFRARRLIVAPGAWAAELLADVGVPFEVLRKPLFWYRTPAAVFDESRFPCFLFETPAGEFYGFPRVEPYGVKVAEHTSGDVVPDPLHVARELHAADRRGVEEFASRALPGLGSDLAQHAVCLYTMSPDRNFVVDRHPRADNVVFAAGLSGHGFKFTAVLGQALAELALDGHTDLPIGFLARARFGGAY